jgi:phosphohistidine phosphatase
MKIYSIRHGIAADTEDYLRDEDRPLVAAGMTKTRQIARRLGEIGVKFDLILTSPLLRSYQTAEILLNAGLACRLEECSHLAPGGNLEAWLSWWEAAQYNSKIQSLAIVGHQPDLSNWAELLLWGNIREQIVLKKAGILGLQLPEQGSPLGNSTLFLLTSPKWLIG